MAIKNLTIYQEQEAFNKQLNNLMKKHRGKYALCKHGKPINYYDSFDEAYQAGLDRFGLDDHFLIAQVEKQYPTMIYCAR